jgi:hypothetical protein
MEWHWSGFRIRPLEGEKTCHYHDILGSFYYAIVKNINHHGNLMPMKPCKAGAFCMDSACWTVSHQTQGVIPIH